MDSRHFKLSREPQFYKHISENDAEFAHTPYLAKIAWLKNENDDLYDPDYSDVLRVCFTAQFERGRMADLVSLLSGRNFETRTFEQDIMDVSFQICSRIRAYRRLKRQANSALFPSGKQS